MRILILTPTALPSITGNAITSERWRRSLEGKGIDVKVLATESTLLHDLAFQLRAFSPDLIHVLHAFRAGAMLLDPEVADLIAEIPLVVSPGGTDINLDFEVANRKETVIQIYRTAGRIIAQSKETLIRLNAIFPAFWNRTVHVPQAFSWLGHDPFDLRETAGWEPEGILFFMPAGIRPVKGNLECLTIFEKVHAARPHAHIVFAGPALDTEYTARFGKKIAESRSFAKWMPSIPPAAMRSAYETSDIVLNTSSSEGLSNALLEAVAAGKPVLASDIPGNWWPVLGEGGGPSAGCLFKKDDPEDFVQLALRLIDDGKLREALSQAGRERASHWPTPEMEADGLIQVYRAATGTS